MKRLTVIVGLGAGLLLLTGPAHAQWRYTDDKGVSKVTQYKIDVPAAHRDAAEWIGPVGIGKPGLSADQVRAAQLLDAIRRIAAAEAGLLRYKAVQSRPLPRVDPGPGRPMAVMCVAGELRAMTSPGSWRVLGGCSPGFSTGYQTDGYGSFGGVTVR